MKRILGAIATAVVLLFAIPVSILGVFFLMLRVLWLTGKMLLTDNKEAAEELEAILANQN